MALICENGEVTQAPDGSPLCSGDWVYHAGVTIEQLFNFPLSEDLNQAWLLGFGLPMICYLVCWGYGVVVNFFKPQNEEIQ